MVVFFFFLSSRNTDNIFNQKSENQRFYSHQNQINEEVCSPNDAWPDLI